MRFRPWGLLTIWGYPVVAKVDHPDLLHKSDVGGVRDPEFGAMVVAGLGGVLVETQRDVQLAVAPVDTGQALAMVVLAWRRDPRWTGGSARD